MRQPADVVQIERIGSVVRSGDVSIGPVRRLLQIEHAIAVGQAPRQTACALQSKVEFCSPEFEVVAPFRLWIKAERNCGKEVSARSGVCQIEDVLRGKQALAGIGWIA